MDVTLKGIISRILPSAFGDDREDDKPVRLWRYGEIAVMSRVRKTHVLNDEGTYFVCNNGQTGVASPTGTTFSATAGLLNIFNTDSYSNPNAKRVHLDYAALITTAAGSFASAGVNLQIAVTLDNNDRYSSGGSDITSNIVSPNMDLSPKSVAKVRFGALTLTAASSSARTICGLRILRPVVSTTVADVVGEQKVLNFGGVEANLNGSITVANANNIPLALPCISIGPQQSLNVHFIMNGTTPGAASYAPELGWWES